MASINPVTSQTVHTVVRPNPTSAATAAITTNLLPAAEAPTQAATALIDKALHAGHSLKFSVNENKEIEVEIIDTQSGKTLLRLPLNQAQDIYNQPLLDISV